MYKIKDMYHVQYKENNKIIDSKNFKDIESSARYIIEKANLDNLIIETRIDNENNIKLNFNEGYNLGISIASVQLEETKKNIIKK